MKMVGTVGVWDVLEVDHLDLPPGAFEHLISSFSRAVRLRRPGAQAIVATDVVSRSIAHLIRRRARRFGMHVEVVSTIKEACRILHRSQQAIPDPTQAIRAVSGGAS